MKVLVFGAGVLGCNLARNLFRAGKDVTLLARGNWASEIQKNGLRIKDKFSPRMSVSRIIDANIEGYRAIRNAGHEILPKEDSEFEGEAYRKTCLRFFKLLCATALGKICSSDHAMSAVDEMTALARALLKDAPVILLDEAAASLDVDNETEIQAAITQLVRGKTVLIIAHRMRTVENADQLVVLDGGVVAECGTHQALMENTACIAG